jgi:hypothetical protein
MPNAVNLDLIRSATAAIAAGTAAAATKSDNNMTQADVSKVVAAATPIVEAGLREAQSRVDYITNNESLPASWTFNSAILALLSSGLTLYGALSDGYQANADQIVVIGAGGTFLSAVGWFVGRWRGKPIGQ